MKRSEFYGFRLPERGAREGEANDPADIEDLTYDLELIDAEMERQRVVDAEMEKKKATREELMQHTGNTANPHKVTKDQVGLSNVPNVATNDQTPTYEAAAAPAALENGETLSAAFAKIAAAVAALIAHLADKAKHITATERTAWNSVKEKLPLAGGTLTGFLTLYAEPEEDRHAATKKYVDGTAAQASSGNMSKSVYDADGDGVVDDAAKLGGKLPEYYAGAQAMSDALAGKAASSHTHDNRYYTETETDNLLAGKAASSHTHTKAQVGLGNVDNTADSAKSVNYAASAGYATSAGSAVDQTARDSASSAATEASNAQTTANNAMPKSGGTFSGNVSAYSTNRKGLNLRNCGVWAAGGMTEVSTNELRFVRK